MRIASKLLPRVRKTVREPFTRFARTGPSKPNDLGTLQAISGNFLGNFRSFQAVRRHKKKANFYRAHAKGVVQQRTLLRRVLETGFEKVLRRILRRCLAVCLQGGRVLRRVLRRGSKKGLSRRHLEGRNTPFREYDPVGVRPILLSNKRLRVVVPTFRLSVDSCVVDRVKLIATDKN